ncbi:MAG: cytochrome c biogenesis protein CcsA [Chloroflexi bacterium]|nr:cytochrome c biogenesis protein CcsA [Chloroflexota bacterium]
MGMVRTALLGVTAVMVAVTLYLGLLWAPPDAIMGDVQRIFYFHVPIAWVGFLAFGIVFVASIAYLVKGTDGWDHLAYSAAEIGVLFATLILVTGSIWGKPVWGVWWQWTPQLTTSLILWFIYLAYLLLRIYGPAGGQGARYAAVLGIIGFIDVPIVYFSSILWREWLHPGKVVGPAGGSVEPSMMVVLMVSLVTSTVLFSYLLLERYTLRKATATVERMWQLHG